MIGELEPPTRNLSGTLPNASDDPLPSKVNEPFVVHLISGPHARGITVPGGWIEMPPAERLHAGTSSNQIM